MNSENTSQPEVSDAPDQAVQLSTDDRLSAVTREAAEAVEAEAPLQAEDAGEVDVVDEPSADGVEAEAVQPEEDAEGQIEEEAESVEDVEEAVTEDGSPWDGDPATVPDELKAGFDKMSGQMNKALQKKFREIDEVKKKKLREMDTVKKQYEAEIFKYQQAQREMQHPQQSAPQEGSPPKPPGEGATAEDWQEYEAKSAEHHYKKFNAEQSQEVAELREKQMLDDRLKFVTSQDGATQEVLTRMSVMAEANPRYQEMFYQSEEAARQFFNEAKFALEKEAFEAEKAGVATKQAEAAKAAAKRMAGAAGRATPRPGGTKAASAPEEVFSRKSFRSVDDKLNHFRDDFMNGTD